MRSIKFYVAFCFHKLMFIEGAGGKSRENGVVKRDVVRLIKLSVDSSLLNWCGYKIKS